MWYKLSNKKINRFYVGNKFNPQMFRSFVEANKFNRFTYSAFQNHREFMETGRNTYKRNVPFDYPPYVDHSVAFKSTSTGAVCLTYQPYADYPDAYKILPEVEWWAKERGIQADIYNPEYSWYYPYVTSLIVIHLPGIKISVTNQED